MNIYVSSKNGLDFMSIGINYYFSHTNDLNNGLLF